jgi:hypothetical protein
MHTFHCIAFLLSFQDKIRDNKCNAMFDFFFEPNTRLETTSALTVSLLMALLDITNSISVLCLSANDKTK